MIIKAKPISTFWMEWAGEITTRFFRSRFNKMVINGVEIKPDHSYLLMCNHFSFMDGFLAIYITLRAIHKKRALKGFYMMVLKKQMQKHWWLKYIGAFSIAPHSRTVEESLAYASEILSKPGNLLLFYPQGNLESSHIRHIVFKDGITQIVPKIKGDCQLIWSSNIIEYFESVKPSVYYNMLDCGTNHNFDFEKLQQKVNAHHKQAIKKNFRFTEEPQAVIAEDS